MGLELEFWFLWCIGTILNVALMVIFVRYRETRTPENVLLINICIADLTYLLGIVLNVSILVNDHKQAVCLVIAFLRSFTIALTVCSTVAISIQRYRDMKFDNRLLEDERRYRKPFLIVAGVWISAAVLAAVEIAYMPFYYDVYRCADYTVIGVSEYRLAVYGLAPTVVMAVYHCKASSRLGRSANELPGAEAEPLAALHEHRTNTRIISSLATSIYLSHLPHFTFLLIFVLMTRNDIHGTATIGVYMVTIVTRLLNPLFNSIALLAASAQLRRLGNQCFCCWCRPNNASSRVDVAMQENIRVTQ